MIFVMNKFFLFIIPIVTMVACTSFFRKDTDRQPANLNLSPDLYKNSLRELPSSADPTYSDLITLLQIKQPETISGLIDELYSSYPGYFRHFTLAYDSLSLHESSFENPRAIIYGKTGNLILTFNGHPDQRGYSNLEIMEFDKIQGHKFREITFLKEPHAKVDLTASEIELRTQNHVVSKPNIGKCTQCHGQKITKPIWQPYFVWPGIYGSDDDFVYRRMKSVDRAAHLVGTDSEMEGYLKYILGKNLDRSGRFNGEIKDFSSRYVKLPVIRFSSLGEEILSEDGRVSFVTSREKDSSIRPNLILNRIISDQLARLTLNKIKENESGKTALSLIMLMHCYDYASYTSPLGEWRTQVFYQNFPNFLKDYQKGKLEDGDQARSARVEDFFRLDELFGGQLTLPRSEIGLGTESSEIAPVIMPGPRIQTAESLAAVNTDFFRSVDEFEKNGAGSFGSKGTVLSMILKSVGLNLREIYAYDLRRTPNYNEGYGGVYSFMIRAPYELAELLGKREPLTCADIQTLFPAR